MEQGPHDQELIAQLVHKDGQTPIWQIALDLEKAIDRAMQPGKFRSLYYRWYGENVRATMRYVRLHTPKQVRRLRETQDMMEFGMIIRFLCHDHETYDKSLAYVLNEMPLPSPNFTMKI